MLVSVASLAIFGAFLFVQRLHYSQTVDAVLDRYYHWNLTTLTTKGENFFVLAGTASATLLIISICLLGILAQSAYVPHAAPEASDRIKLTLSAFHGFNSYYIALWSVLIGAVFGLGLTVALLALAQVPRSVGAILGVYATVSLIAYVQLRSDLRKTVREVKTFLTALQAELESKVNKPRSDIQEALAGLQELEDENGFATRHLFAARLKRYVSELVKIDEQVATAEAMLFVVDEAVNRIFRLQNRSVRRFSSPTIAAVMLLSLAFCFFPYVRIAQVICFVSLLGGLALAVIVVDLFRDLSGIDSRIAEAANRILIGPVSAWPEFNGGGYCSLRAQGAYEWHGILLHVTRPYSGALSFRVMQVDEDVEFIAAPCTATIGLAGADSLLRVTSDFNPDYPIEIGRMRLKRLEQGLFGVLLIELATSSEGSRRSGPIPFVLYNRGPFS